MSGAFQTSREIFENPIWQDIPKFRIFFYIVGNAVYAEEGRVISGVHVKRGQFLRAYRNLANDLEYIENRSVKKYSLSVISRKVEQLVKEERLKIEDTELGTLFTVVNYALYQGFDHYKKTTWNSVGTDLERSENGNGKQLEQGWNNNNKDNKDISITTTTSGEEKSEMTVMSAYTKSFGGLFMNGHIQDYVGKIRAKGADDAFLIELFLETGESSTKPNLKLLQAIGDSWLQKGIRTRQQSKIDKEEGSGRGKYGKEPERHSENAGREAGRGQEQFIGSAPRPVSDAVRQSINDFE